MSVCVFFHLFIYLCLRRTATRDDLFAAFIIKCRLQATGDNKGHPFLLFMDKILAQKKNIRNCVTKFQAVKRQQNTNKIKKG